LTCHQRPHRALYFAASILLASFGCAPSRIGSGDPGPVVLLGIDGASWSVIEELWSAGKLPNFARLAESGIRSRLIPVADASPVIWTSIATGVLPERHGITNFVVRSDGVDVPVSSTIRKVPAIWNMVSTAGGTVAVLGWWASWPAEPVSGVVVSDRPLGGGDDAFYPAEYSSEFDASVTRFGSSSEARAPETRIERQDRAIGAVARDLITDGFDLLLLYQRNVDAESHQYWRYFRPGEFDPVPEDELNRYRHRIPRAYEAADELLGDLLAAAPPNTTFFVVSDHGFYALKRPRRRVSFDLDQILEAMGFLSHRNGVVDWPRTRALTWDSPPEMRIKLVRLARSDSQPAGAVTRNEVEETRNLVASALTRLTYGSGKPVFRVRPPHSEEAARGGDIVAVVQSEGATPEIVLDGQPIRVEVRISQEISGSHSKGTEGIFIASGPIIDPEVKIDSIDALDITPTLLAAMGLPVAEDFDGTARLELFHKRFLHDHPPRSITSWGQRQPGEASTSDQDAALVEELKALGYLE